MFFNLIINRMIAFVFIFMGILNFLFDGRRTAKVAMAKLESVDVVIWLSTSSSSGSFLCY